MAIRHICQSLEYCEEPHDVVKSIVNNMGCREAIFVVDDFEELILNHIFKAISTDALLEVLYGKGKKRSFSALNLISLLFTHGFREFTVQNEENNLAFPKYKNLLFKGKTYRVPLLVVRAALEGVDVE